MIKGFGKKYKIDSNSEIIKYEDYNTSFMEELGYVILHKIFYESGLTDVHIYPDLRRNLEEQLADSIHYEQYELAAELRDILENISYEIE